ncbi:MAG: tetratricopeptide repeat protein [Deltaproteobacteria bacterium]|nr:tetratricopeptide repeat protein [Deltaproteobacteria bacterium]
MRKTAKPAPVVRMADYKNRKRNNGSAVWAYLLIMAVITFAVYLNSIGNGFVADDTEFIKNNISIRRLENIPDFFLSPKTLASNDSEWGTIIYRPLRTASYAVDYAIYGLWAPGYHITSLALHIIASITVFYVILSLFNIPVAAFTGSLLFALHPVHIEAVSWIASRADIIGLLFLNLSLLSYIRYQRDRLFGYIILSLALSFLSYLGKETMIFLPGVIIFYDYATQNKNLKGLARANAVSWVLFSAVCVFYLALRFNITGRMSTNQGWWGGSLYSNFLMMAKAAAVYLRLLVLPYGFTFHYIIDPVQTLLNPAVIISVAAVLFTTAVIVYSRQKNRVVFFCLAWFYLGLIPIANIIPISFSMMAERYIYAASFGPIAAISYGGFRLYEWARDRGANALYLAAGAVALILTVFSIQIIGRNRDYKDEFAFYSSAVKVSPGSAPGNKGLADEYYKKKDYETAILYYERAIAIDPGYVEAHLGEALTYREKGETAKALSAAKRAAAVEEKVALKKPKNALIKFNLGNIYREMGDMDAARSAWEEAVELNPEYSEALNHLGIYYQMESDFPKAISMFERSLRSNPYNAETQYNMAILLEAQGDKERAKEHFRRFIENAGPEYRDEAEEVKRSRL